MSHCQRTHRSMPRFGNAQKSFRHVWQAGAHFSFIKSAFASQWPWTAQCVQSLCWFWHFFRVATRYSASSWIYSCVSNNRSTNLSRVPSSGETCVSPTCKPMQDSQLFRQFISIYWGLLEHSPWPAHFVHSDSSSSHLIPRPALSKQWNDERSSTFGMHSPRAIKSTLESTGKMRKLINNATSVNHPDGIAKRDGALPTSQPSKLCSNHAKWSCSLLLL